MALVGCYCFFGGSVPSGDRILYWGTVFHILIRKDMLTYVAIGKK